MEGSGVDIGFFTDIIVSRVLMPFFIEKLAGSLHNIFFS